MCGFDWVSPLVRLRTRACMVGQTALKVTLNKAAKHEKTCFDNEYVFIPFI